MFTWMVLFALAIFYFGRMVGFLGINASPSIPAKEFSVSKLDTDLERGQLVAFRYYGEFYPHNTNMAKYVVGLPGDEVTADENRNFYINGQFVGRAKEKSMSQEPLEMNTFRGKIPYGKFWYMTPEKDSFDSRYALAGLGDMQDVEGKAYILF